MSLPKYTLGVCDDEVYWQKELIANCQTLQANKPFEFEYHIFSSGEELMKNKIDLDILFLDEEMYKISGQMVKDYFEDHNINTMIVFVTSHTEILYDSFGKNVYGFLNKPIIFSDFSKIMNKLLDKLNNAQYIIVPVSIHGEQKILCKNILYIQAEGNYVKIVLENLSEYFIRKNLNEIKQLIHYKYIVCVHKSYLVNLAQQCKPTSNCASLILKTGIEIPVARRRKKEVQQLYLEFITERANILWES